MSNEIKNDEIDFNQLFDVFKRSFKRFLKAIISVIVFYKKKAILFIALLVVGLGIGYLLDTYSDTSVRHNQEIIIEPKYNSTKYIYDFVDELESNFKDTKFLTKVGITIPGAKNIKEITIEPLIKGTDVLDNLQERYENREFFKDIMEAYDENQVEEEKFRDFYKHHKLVFRYKNKSEENEKVTKSILEYIKSNAYYKQIVNTTLKQKEVNLEQNKKTLQFIDEYLVHLSNNPLNAEKGTMVIMSSKKEELPTVSVASLLQKKELLLELINEQERALIFDKELFSYVYFGDVISTKNKIVNRSLFTMPLFLIALVSVFFFLKHLYRKMNEFVNDNEE